MSNTLKWVLVIVGVLALVALIIFLTRNKTSLTPGISQSHQNVQDEITRVLTSNDVIGGWGQWRLDNLNPSKSLDSQKQLIWQNGVAYSQQPISSEPYTAYQYPGLIGTTGPSIGNGSVLTEIAKLIPFIGGLI